MARSAKRMISINIACAGAWARTSKKDSTLTGNKLVFCIIFLGTFEFSLFQASNESRELFFAIMAMVFLGTSGSYTEAQKGGGGRGRGV